MTERHHPSPEAELASEAERAEVLGRFAEHPYANLETYKYFNQRGEVAAAAKTDFIDVAITGQAPAAPEFAYPSLDTDALVARRDELTELLHDVLRLDMEVEENRLLREKVTDRLHEVGIMLLARIQSDLGPDHPMYEAVSFQLGENMREVYGRPEAEHWRGILGYRLSLLAEVEGRADAPDSVREAWEFVRDSLPQDLPVEKPYEPRPDTLRWYREQLDARVAPAREAVQAAINDGVIIVGEDGRMTGENVVLATRVALDALDIQGWDVQESDESNVDTSQEHSTIFIPTKRTKGDMTLEDFDAVILSHEIDQHVARRDNGDKSGEPILGGTGCAGYLGWEEGNGKANEALLAGKVDNEESAFKHFLSGGLALGLDREQGRNFGETFDLVWRMRYVAEYLNGKQVDDEAFQRNLMSKVYDDLRRLYRGTDGRSPGVIFPKDAMTYYLGQTDVWRKWDQDMDLDEDARREEHELERSAKINPLRDDHRRVAIRAREQQAA